MKTITTNSVKLNFTLRTQSVRTGFSKLVLGSFLLLSYVGTQAQTTYYVNSLTGDDLNSGTSAAPFQTFHKAYSTAASGDVVDLTGTFDWTNIDETGDAATSGYTISKNITIQGQGADETFIQAAPTANIADRRVFTITNSPVLVHIQNLTIRYGKTAQGGGILCGSSGNSDANLNISFCNIEDNNVFSVFGSAEGGALCLGPSSGGMISIDKCNIRNNAALASFGSEYGGAIYVNSGSLSSGIVTISSSTINNNSSALDGGGIYGTYSNINLINSTVAYNSCTGAGSAFAIRNQASGDNFMTNVTVAYNTSSGTVSGSAVSVGGSSTLYIMNCLLADNTYSSGLSDGDFYHNTGTVNDNGSNIVENSSGFSFTQPGDIIGNQPSLNLVSILASNNTINNSLTLEILPGSIAINAGSIGSNGGILVPAEDQRGGSQFGMIDIGAFEFGAGGPVPVVLIDFRAQAELGQNSVLLTWSTAQEVNNSHFNVQRSIEGENWENIGQVSGNGTISSLSSYIFTDADARPIAYYRLEQVDYNGISEYSPIVRVDFMGIVPIEIIGSNPVYSELDVLINAEYSVNTIEIYDMYGVMVYSEKLEGALSTISLDVSELAVGTYFITLNNEENARIRFVKS